MSSALHLDVEAVDTLLFRDGRPFNQNDEGASEAVSVFPPYPPTLVGAVRLALAKRAGYPSTAWPEERLGCGVDWSAEDPLGQLSFSAPLLTREGEAVFPLPLNVARGKTADGQDRLTRLVPGPLRTCDLGDEVALPVAEDGSVNGPSVPENSWVTLAGMKAVLAGGLPAAADVLKRTDLWCNEPRVGIGLDSNSRQVETGQLYMASHVRPRKGVRLYLRVAGASAEDFPEGLHPLAGEHRMAAFRATEEVALPTTPDTLGRETDGSIRYLVVLLSPCLLERLPEPGESLPGLPGRVVSACLGRGQTIGGWDSCKKRPIAMHPAVPAGSLWYLTASEAVGDLRDVHGTHIGAAQAWGFGQMLVGTW